jgi:hypothetical protein
MKNIASCNEEHHNANGRENKERAKIRLHGNEERGETQEDTKRNESFFESGNIGLTFLQPHSKIENERKLEEFRGLKVKRTKVKPASRSSVTVSKSRNEKQHNTPHGKKKNCACIELPETVGNDTHHKHRKESYNHMQKTSP